MKKMSILFVTLLLYFFLWSAHTLVAQDFLWKAGVHSFFDNTEFGHSKVQMPQSMSGMHLAPELGIGWGEKHRVFAGIDAMHEYGSDKTVDFYDPIAYYQFTGETPFRFYMGAFPRQIALDKYPRMFFQDSIKNYRPIVNGLFWEYDNEKLNFNLWLDWATRQTRTRHESFFMGWSGRYNYSLFYVQHFGYMFHFAGTQNPEVIESVHDNGLILTSIGLDLAQKTGFEKLEANIGWSKGYDRERDRKFWNYPQGILAEVKAEYKGLGVFNSYYRGDSQQVYHGDHGNELYWGDPIYRSKEYDRCDAYINFIKTNAFKIKFMWTFHLTEQHIYHEQSLYVTFDLDNFTRSKDEKKYEYLWDNWF